MSERNEGFMKPTRVRNGAEERGPTNPRNWMERGERDETIYKFSTPYFLITITAADKTGKMAGERIDPSRFRCVIVLQDAY